MKINSFHSDEQEFELRISSIIALTGANTSLVKLTTLHMVMADELSTLQTMCITYPITPRHLSAITNATSRGVIYYQIHLDELWRLKAHSM